MTEEKTTWGGARAGAGRKSLGGKMRSLRMGGYPAALSRCRYLSVSSMILYAGCLRGCVQVRPFLMLKSIRQSMRRNKNNKLK